MCIPFGDYQSLLRKGCIPYLPMARGFANLEIPPPPGSVGFVCYDCRQFRNKDHARAEEITFIACYIVFSANSFFKSEFPPINC